MKEKIPRQGGERVVELLYICAGFFTSKKDMSEERGKGLNAQTYRAALQMMKWLPAVMAVSYLANSAGVYGETMHAVVHYVGMFLAPMGMLYVASYLFRFCWYHRIFIHYLMAKELVNITDWYVGIPITDEEMAELHKWITGVFLAVAITTYIYRRWKDRRS